ncbi:MAG: transcription elongation factor GreA [Patescibacteria group bacterium]
MMVGIMELEKHYLSQEKYNELQRELTDLKKTKRREIAERLEFAKSLGDLSENAEYQAAREEQSNTEERITQLEAILKISQIISLHHTSQVEVGSTLVVKKGDGNEETKYQIVGPEEVDVLAGKISYLSPLGSSLLKKKKGDSVTVLTPKGKITYEIVRLT